MSTSLLALALGATIVAQAPAQPPAQPKPPDPLGKSVASLYQSIRRNVVASAEKMPEEHYGFKPSADVRSYGELLGHIANTQYNFCAPVLGVDNPNRGQNQETKTTKADLVKAVADAFAFCDKAYEGLTDERLHATATWGQNQIAAGYSLMFNIAHANEHYGNLVTYLRLKGIVPPSSEPRR